MSLDIACKDTICALSSGQGRAALAVIRVSGPRAWEILQAVFCRTKKSELKPFMAMRGQALDKEARIIDDVMALYFKQGQSFTGEESFELHCHGNSVIVDQLLRALCDAGARLAEPGEFSMRAMLNGKIDLAQAESIGDLIHAESVAAKDVALKGVLGGLGARSSPVREIIISVLAEIEARMDFPDEELGSVDRDRLGEDLQKAISDIGNILSRSAFSIRLHEGARVVICGLPNAGKSTLLNRLCGEERAIVHESAGTTRDVIEARMTIGGVPVIIVDVAGIRARKEASDIESIGISKAFFELDRADVIIWLADCTLSDPFGDEEIKTKLSSLKTPIIKVLNKADLKNLREKDALPISASNGLGIEDLNGALHKLLVGENNHGSEMYITRARQRDELILARAALIEAHIALEKHMVDEVVASELRAAGLAFDRLFGTTLDEDVLDRIFSQFCIGK